MDVSRPARMLVSGMATARPALGGLSVQAQRCGELLCNAHQYCSRHLLRCRPCTEICSPRERNYQQSACDLQCQDYLHDMTYLRKSDQRDSLEALERVEADLERLTIMVAVMFCLLVFCFLWLVFHACNRRHARWRRRKTHDIEADSIQLKSVAGKVPNGNVPPPLAQVIRDKASTVPQYTLGRHNSSYLMATKNGEELKGARGRHPAEDTCPADYSAAYDNPALAVTPPLEEEGATSHPLAPVPESPPAARARDPRTSQRRRAADPRPRDPLSRSDSRSRDPVGRNDSRSRDPAGRNDSRSRDPLGRAGSDRGSERERPPLDIDITDNMYSARPVHVV